MAHLVSDILESLRNSLVGTVHGQPVEVGGRTVVPVAFVWCGAGGGADQEGSSGGGGGGCALPVGAYVSTDAGAVFRPNPVALLVGSAPVVAAAGFAAARVVRALRR
ncbi:hypothetical protein ACX8Z9_12625 [Arthrobacter halodurans]|uniref:Sporulation protein YtfJ (Spore_YtfJ) n=1 Tax=Arthrobacter halodurans TaxID=516699 RepID=A0ABV4UP42_9MICC